MQTRICRIWLESGSLLFAAFSLIISASAGAQSPPADYSEQNKLIRAPQAYSRLGTNLFGDKVNLYTGTLEFVQTDVSIPGNSALPVSVGRRLVAGNDPLKGGLFGSWDIEIPHLHGIFSRSRGWRNVSDTVARCSEFTEPPTVGSMNEGYWAPNEYWRGSFLYVPGHGDQELLNSSTSTVKPSDNLAYPVATRNNWVISCLPGMASGNGYAGEAFLALSPDGTKYRFDWMAERPATQLQKTSIAPENRARAVSTTTQSPSVADKPSDDLLSEKGEVELPSPDVAISPYLNRQEYWILPTVVTDKYGNTVNYTYDTANKWQLKTISGNDASGSPRTITLTYRTPGSKASNIVDSVTDGTRTWSYHYDKTDTNAKLLSVTLPDQSAWTLDQMSSLLTSIVYAGDGNCSEPGFISNGATTGSLKHPSGAIGTFTLTPTRHGRAKVFEQCYEDYNMGTFRPYNAKMFDTMALTAKSISGSGLPPMNWTTSYPAEASSWSTCTTCSETKVVSVTDPEGGITSHTFGTRFQETEGRPLGVTVAGPDGVQLRDTRMFYTDPLPAFGSSLLGRGDGVLAAKVIELNRREIVQQGVTFTWQATAFDRFAHPTQVRRFSPFGDRSETTVYDDNLGKWVIGQVKQVTEASSGKVMVFNEYDPASSALLAVTTFGQLQSRMTYTDGNLRTLADGKGQTTTFTNYKRGIAQNIVYANNASESAVVNNLGRIDFLTNEAGATTSFGYDGIGRLSEITHPVGDTMGWNSVQISFMPTSSAQYDLEAGHWRQQIKVGNAITSIDFDAFWRPVYTHKWDEANPGGTMRVTKNTYDSAGRDKFVSYPQRGYAEGGPGTTFYYDALGRPVTTRSNSELGELSSYTAYDNGFQTGTSNPRGVVSTYTYQAFDDPGQSAITQINSAEGVSVVIARDAFGKASAITRSGAGRSVTRSYVYDDAQRLCKTIEPEVGATVQDYDAAGNIAWRGTGLTLPATNACDTASVAASRKTTFYYDARNRLKTTTFGDGGASIARTYTPDGLPETINSDGTAWTYYYNKRRMLERESLVYGGGTYNIDYAYDANGSLSQLRYPVENLTIAYNPNALGEATQVGGYASDITYHPNGAVKSFMYGNGIVHEMYQNIRGLPERASDAGILNDVYTYDANANVAGIGDFQQGGLNTRSQMGYDGLDRLKTVSAPALWGTATYDYDAQDNLTSTTISGGGTARTTSHVINPNTNRLDQINGPAAYNFGFAYDDQGNVKSRGAQAFKFDLGNRLKEAPGRSNYVYDGLGRRVSTLGTDNINRIQVYNQAGQLLYATGGGSTIRYVYLNRHVIAEVKR